jgi:cyclopropane fatty-acyl-phospholipid synthase-like methyltransferase
VSRIYSDEAELYDIAFGWDVSAEAEWLVARLGQSCRTALEPGCGSGRMLEALARCGLEVVGLDISEPMVSYARARLAGAGIDAEVVRADMRDFDLGRRFDGAVSPVGTVGLLSPAGFASHLQAMARHLEPGSRYLVQQGIQTRGSDLWRSEWEAERDDVRLRIVWEAIERDLASGRERSRSRVEVLSGARAGEVVEDLHANSCWTAAAWRAAIAASPLEQVACYDGAEPARPAAELERGGGRLWHELRAP